MSIQLWTAALQLQRLGDFDSAGQGVGHGVHHERAAVTSVTGNIHRRGIRGDAVDTRCKMRALGSHHRQRTTSGGNGRALDNYARVDLFRNGGGDGLEGHDEDQVTQTAKAVTVNLDQTGRNVIIGLAAALAVAAAAAAALIYRRRTRAPAADDDGYDREDYGHEDRHGDGYDRADYGYDDRYRDEIRDRY